MQEAIRDQVQAYVSGRILARLDKLGATELPNLRAHAAEVRYEIPATETRFEVRRVQSTTLPASVVNECLTHLGNLGMVRKFRYRGVTFVAKSDASREALVAAMQRTFGTFKVDDKTFPVAAFRASRISYAEAANVPDAGDNSQEEDAMLYEASVTSPVDAEQLPSLNNEEWEPAPAPTPVSAEIQAKIDYQDRIGQGPRNTKRAFARWLKTAEGQAWKERKANDDAAEQELQQMKRRQGPADAAMSPEQALLDHAKGLVAEWVAAGMLHSDEECGDLPDTTAKVMVQEHVMGIAPMIGWGG